MVVTDCICFNKDRHAGNYGVLFDNNTMQIKTMAPVFDLNLSLLCNVPESGLDQIGDALYGCVPKIGTDFTRTGQLMLTDQIRDRVKDLQDFTFSFRGNEDFPEARVRKTEEIVQRQAVAVLSAEKLMLKDVFFSAQAERKMEENRSREKREQIADEFADIVQDIADQNGMIAGPGNAETGTTCILENRNVSMVVDFDHGKIIIEKDGHLVDPFHVSSKEREIIPVYNSVLQKLCEYTEYLADPEYPVPEYMPAKEERELDINDFEL